MNSVDKMKLQDAAIAQKENGPSYGGAEQAFCLGGLVLLVALVGLAFCSVPVWFVWGALLVVAVNIMAAAMVCRKIDGLVEKTERDGND